MDDDDEGLAIKYEPDKLAEDVDDFKEDADSWEAAYIGDNGNDDDDDDDEDDDGLDFNFYGTIHLITSCDVRTGSWNITFAGGNVGTNIKGEYEWEQQFTVGSVLCVVELKLGFGVDMKVAFTSKSDVRAMLLDTTLSLSVNAFAGLGFDMSIVALKLGIMGQIGASANYLYMVESGESDRNGTKLDISGEIGVRLEVKVLLVTYKKTFCSTGFGWSRTYNSYDAIKQAWQNNGYADLSGTTRGGRNYTMRLLANNTALVTVEGEGEIENRDYLEMADRVWNSGSGSGRRLMTSALPASTLTAVWTPISRRASAVPPSPPISASPLPQAATI